MDFVQIAGQLGVPVALLAAAGFAVWRSIVFFGKHIAVPLTQRHIEHIQVQERCLEQQTKTMEELQATTKKVAATQSDFVGIVRKIAEVQEKHLEICTTGHGAAAKGTT